METASSPILHSFRICGGATRTSAVAAFTNAITNSNLYFPINSQHSFTSGSNNSLFTSSRNCFCHDKFGRKSEKRFSFSTNSSAEIGNNATDCNSSLKLAILLEVEGVLMDVYRSCNREAFNTAFRKLGLDCANWSQPVYIDLLRKSAGDEEMMLVSFFNKIGWPTSVPTSQKESFMRSVLREKKNALGDLVTSDSYSLKPGAEEFIDEACKEDVPVIILTAYSTSGEKVARSVVEKLGSDRISKIKIVGDEDVQKSFYGQLVFGKGVSSSLDDLLAKEVNKAASAERQRIAEEVASILKLKVELNNSSSESIQKTIAALRAGAEYAEVPINNCVLVAGSQSGLDAAERIGMPSVVLRSSSTPRAEYPSAIAVLDGFGGADLTISKLRKKLSS